VILRSHTRTRAATALLLAVAACVWVLSCNFDGAYSDCLASGHCASDANPATADSGPPQDSGPTDAGPPAPDAGPDAGKPDAGPPPPDAGPDAGVDAGDFPDAGDAGEDGGVDGGCWVNGVTCVVATQCCGGVCNFGPDSGIKICS